MNKTTGLRGLQLFVGGALMLVASLSQAQWVWVDAKGVKQFSDRSPPPSVPQKNILKAPRGQAMANDVAAPAAATPAAAASAAKPTVADREAEYKKRQADKAEADKKLAAETSAANAKKSYCDSVRAQKSTIDSGVKVTNAAGNVMDDAERAKESAAARKALADC